MYRSRVMFLTQLIYKAMSVLFTIARVLCKIVNMAILTWMWVGYVNVHVLICSVQSLKGGGRQPREVGGQMSSDDRNFREGKSSSGWVQKYIHVVYESTPELRTSTVL